MPAQGKATYMRRRVVFEGVRQWVVTPLPDLAACLDAPANPDEVRGVVVAETRQPYSGHLFEVGSFVPVRLPEGS